MNLKEGGEKCIKRSFTICTLRNILLGQTVKEEKIGWECSTHRKDKMSTKLQFENLNRRGHWEYLLVCGRIILK
jgi:hypothetical protein